MHRQHVRSVHGFSPYTTTWQEVLTGEGVWKNQYDKERILIWVRCICFWHPRDSPTREQKQIRIQRKSQPKDRITVAAKSEHNTLTVSEDDQKTPTVEDEKTSASVITTEHSRHTWQRSMLLNGKSLHAVYSYSDWLVFRRKVYIRFGEIHSWILSWNNWSL